ncbi:MAG: glycoside hydrolase family 6 protein [Gemmatimonadetes bacterium]|nr:glycoside hydrolase family 6 protein [Gemmatimonadota bacterium]
MVASADTAGTDPGTGTLAGATFWPDPYSNAAKQAEEWRLSRPEDAAYMDVIAAEAQADWFGDWNGDVRAEVDARTTTITATGALPVYVAYNIPLRDCSSYSGGGATSADAYRSWIRAFAEGLAGRPAAVVLEPDGLALMGCLSDAQQQERLALLADAVEVLSAGGAWVYLDAGHARWHPAATTADRLLAAGVAQAAGFALNVSNFVADGESVLYGESVSDLLGGARFIVDSSRNGLGPADGDEWCNPDGRALGTRPTTVTGHDRVDAFLWIKRPGESDGTCNGGPSAGSWWADYALGLAKRAVDGTTTTVVAASDG